ncbi:HAD family phosphatase [Salinimicrobium sp. MT39]|uniref:HAD family phosphatase n=1 Tax=Salinimicrobium profundisediminis TaxID=2994553 RepID=A0A9X3CVG3_9FLAO|nr:HAD family phosphatase [Salinimicrobium profundisediminis]MCX2837612.1 HAD family phosphatase [Salinimicrobium profundisediminis]
MIKTIIFDFGDVFLNLDKPATARELKKFEISHFSEEMLQQNMAYEKGLISSEAFISGYSKSFPKLTSEVFVKSWNSILIDFPKYRLEFLQQLKEEGKYKLILLSNTNHIHIDWVKQHISFFEEFKNCFDAFYLSQEINLRKPDQEIYSFVLQQHDLNPEETLFIDDTPENTEAAAKLGIHTWNIDPVNEDVVDLFTIKSDLF